MTSTLLRAAAMVMLLAATAGAETITYENETEPYPGVRLLERHTSGPSWRIYAAYISLCHDGVHVEARSSQSVRITAAAWGSAMGAQLAVNGDFFRTDRSTPTVYGDAVGVGMRWPVSRSGLGDVFSGDWYYGKYGWIAFGDGWVELTHSKWVKDHADSLGVSLGWYPQTRTTEIPPGTEALVSGFPELVVEGEALSDFPDRGDMADRHPRTAMGLTEDRQTFILVVVDGRSSASVGMNGAELAALMKDLGAHTAFNLDGGGSSQMWLASEGTVNHPSDGSPRPVANHWGIYAGSEHSRGTEPGSCFSFGGCFPTPVPGATSARFADVLAGDPDLDHAIRVVDAGLLPVCSAEPSEMFCPQCELTRRDALVMTVRAAELALGEPPAEPTFSDVPAGAPGFAEIEAAARLGITSGCGDGRFCPDAPVTRAAYAAFLARARGWTDTPPAAPTFTDVPADDPLYAEIEASAAHCVELACAGDAFCPGDGLGRALGARVAVRGFDLDGANDCAGADPDDPDDPGGDPDDPGGGGAGAGSGGCAAPPALPGGAALVVVLASLLAIARRNGGYP